MAGAHGAPNGTKGFFACLDHFSFAYEETAKERVLTIITLAKKKHAQ